MGNHRPQHTKNIFRRPRQGTAIKTPKPRLSQLLKVIFMKKLFFLAILATYFVCLGCDKNEPAPVTPTSPSEIGTGLETTYNNNGEIQLRGNCDNCTTCCCTLTVVGPSNTTAGVDFCSSVFPSCGSPFCGCAIGDGTCGPGTPSGSNGETANLQVGVLGEDYKEWCAGDNTVPFVITNTESMQIFYTIDCGLGIDTFSLQGLQSAYITKGTDCKPTVNCRYF